MEDCSRLNDECCCNSITGLSLWCHIDTRYNPPSGVLQYGDICYYSNELSSQIK